VQIKAFIIKLATALGLILETDEALSLGFKQQVVGAVGFGRYCQSFEGSPQ